MSVRTIHRVTADSAGQTGHQPQPSSSFQASNMNGALPLGSARAQPYDQFHSDLRPPSSVMIPTASMKRRMKDSDRPGVPTGTAVCARSLFNRLYQERLGRETLDEDFPIYTTMANSIKDEIRSFLYHRLRIDRGTRTYSSVKNEFPSQISNLRRRLNETYPVLAVAQGGWVFNEFLKEAIQRDKKAASEAAKRQAAKRATRAEERVREDARQDEVRPSPEERQSLTRMAPLQGGDVNQEATQNETNGCPEHYVDSEEIQSHVVENEEDEISGVGYEQGFDDEYEPGEDENNDHDGDGQEECGEDESLGEGLEEDSEEDSEEVSDDGVVDEAGPPAKARANAPRKPLPRSQLSRDVEGRQASAKRGSAVLTRALNHSNLSKKQPRALFKRRFARGANGGPPQRSNLHSLTEHGVTKSKNHGSKSRQSDGKNTRTAKTQRRASHRTST